MKMLAGAALLAIAVAASAGTAAQGKSNGKWSIIERIDKMTDQKLCILQYADNPHVFSDTRRSSLTISRRGLGGVRTHQFRVDSESASGVYLATAGTSETNFISIRHDDIEGRKRLLVQGLGIVGGTFELEIDLRGFDQTLAEAKARCP